MYPNHVTVLDGCVPCIQYVRSWYILETDCLDYLRSGSRFMSSDSSKTNIFTFNILLFYLFRIRLSGYISAIFCIKGWKLNWLPDERRVVFVLWTGRKETQPLAPSIRLSHDVSTNHRLRPPNMQTVSTSHRLCPPVTGCVHQSQSVSTNHRMCSPITECVHQSQDVFTNYRLCPPITGCVHQSQIVSTN